MSMGSKKSDAPDQTAPSGAEKPRTVHQPPAAGGNRAAQRQKVIGQGLQKMFKDVVDEPVPDEFLALLDKLDQLDDDDSGAAPKGQAG